MEVVYMILTIFGSLSLYFYICYLLRQNFISERSDNNLSANSTNQTINPVRDCTVAQ